MAITYNPPQQQLAPPPPGGDGSIYGNSNAISAYNAQTQNRAKFGGSKKNKKIRRVTLTPALIIIGGRSKKQFKGGVANSIVVPAIQVPFKDTGAGNNTVAANVTNSVKVGAALNANSEFDNQVGKSGGQKGGWPEWRCMSGGIKSKRKSKRKSSGKCRKTKKCRRKKR
jgi:hypothetical protein